MSQEINYLTTQDAVDTGVLQEVNRQFLHPLGLALELVWDGDPSDRDMPAQFRMWDYRRDPEGVLFGESIMAAPEAREKWNRIRDLQDIHRGARAAALGGAFIQPLGTPQ